MNIFLTFCAYLGGYVVALILLVAASFTRRTTTFVLCIISLLMTVAQGAAMMAIISIASMGDHDGRHPVSFFPANYGALLAIFVAAGWSFLLLRRKRRPGPAQEIENEDVPFPDGDKNPDSQAEAETVGAGSDDQLPPDRRTLAENELAEKSEAFLNFYQSLQRSDPRDGVQIDLGALLALSGAERDEAESLLIERMEGTGGSVIEALAGLKSQRGAAALKEYAERAGGSDAVEAALALWRIEKWPRAEVILIDVLEGRRKYFPDDDDAGLSDVEAMGRQDAARALGEIPSARSRTALNRASNDPDDMVRQYAEEALMFLDEN